jgi:hypothetical protein
MRVTKSKLKKIIEEELMKMLDEQRRGAEGEVQAVTTTTSRAGDAEIKTSPIKFAGSEDIAQVPSQIAGRIEAGGGGEVQRGTRKGIEYMGDVITGRGGSQAAVSRDAALRGLETTPNSLK